MILDANNTNSFDGILAKTSYNLNEVKLASKPVETATTNDAVVGSPSIENNEDQLETASEQVPTKSTGDGLTANILNILNGASLAMLVLGLIVGFVGGYLVGKRK